MKKDIHFTWIACSLFSIYITNTWYTSEGKGKCKLKKMKLSHYEKARPKSWPHQLKKFEDDKK